MSMSESSEEHKRTNAASRSLATIPPPRAQTFHSPSLSHTPCPLPDSACGARKSSSVGAWYSPPSPCRQTERKRERERERKCVCGYTLAQENRRKGGRGQERVLVSNHTDANQLPLDNAHTPHSLAHSPLSASPRVFLPNPTPPPPSLAHLHHAREAAGTKQRSRRNARGIHTACHQLAHLRFQLRRQQRDCRHPRAPCHAVGCQLKGGQGLECQVGGGELALGHGDKALDAYFHVCPLLASQRSPHGQHFLGQRRAHPPRQMQHLCN